MNNPSKGERPTREEIDTWVQYMRVFMKLSVGEKALTDDEADAMIKERKKELGIDHPARTFRDLFNLCDAFGIEPFGMALASRLEKEEAEARVSVLTVELHELKAKHRKTPVPSRSAQEGDVVIEGDEEFPF